MQSYLERYLAGEHVGVWAELVGLGPAVWNEPVYADAQAVAREIMTRAKHNVGLLIDRLTELGYRFIDPDRVWTPPDQAIHATFDALEHRYGPFPLMIRTWYEVVGEVYLIGAHPRLASYDGLDWGGSEKLACYSDPMAIGWARLGAGELLSFYLNLADDWDEIARMEREMPPPYGIDVGLSPINKANHSGSGSIQILVPNPGFDAPLIDWDHYWMGTFFAPHLRACFEWGGFPGLRQLADSDRPQEELDFLTHGLLAL